jgi:hypothetical protein
LLEYYEDHKVELYNLAEDLGERNNLAEGRPNVLKQMRDQLSVWREQVNAQAPTPNPDWRK